MDEEPVPKTVLSPGSSVEPVKLIYDALSIETRVRKVEVIGLTCQNLEELKSKVSYYHFDCISSS